MKVPSLQNHSRDVLRGVCLCSLLAALSCASEPKPVDRVQTNLVDKEIFEGEWWYSGTAIDVDYDQAQILSPAGPFEGAMSTDLAIDFNRGGPSVIGDPFYSFPIARIRWVIDEKFLFAFRSFELVQGGDKDGRSPDYRGDPLAVFKIEDHVDVRNGYNTVTGETDNVRQENTSDRRWYERRFIRVDWSQNLIKSFVSNQPDELFSQFKREPVPFFIQEGSDYAQRYQPKFIRVADDPDYRFAGEWPEEQHDRVHYMSVVTKEVWSPGGSCLTAGGSCASASVTMRNAFLRVPPNHEYAVTSLTDREFEHFGIFRSHQPSYTRGGEDRSTLHEFCASDAQCGPGGSCDLERHVCTGGLTQDRGETDFLSYFASRHNIYKDSLDESKACVSDWECDGRYLTCNGADPSCAKTLADQDGSRCDPAARLCTKPERLREVRPVTYRLGAHFPPYLVRQTFEAVAQWNEALMRGRRASIGQLPVDQYKCADGVCTTAPDEVTRAPMQTDNPADFCYPGSPEERNGSCRRDYDPFESPDQARARGVKNPYECYVVGPADVKSPQDYADYATGDVYSYRFEGPECILTLVGNSCDLDPAAPCEELGDLRYQFITHVQHGGVGFGGVAQPLSDPTTGELIVSNATVAAESIETIGTLASQYFPVLRGDVPEDQYFTGENLRGYYARLGMVEHPVSLAATADADYTDEDLGRPAGSRADLFSTLMTRLESRASKIEKLRGQDGRAAILSDRLKRLDKTPIAASITAAVTADAVGRSSTGAPASYVAAASGEPTRNAAVGTDDDASSVFTNSPLTDELRNRQRQRILASRNIDDFQAKLYNGQYWQYWASAFGGHSLAEASLRMRQLYYKSVMVHEIGHALGLRHNFAGSLDRDNYHDGYFQIAREAPLPYYLDYDDPAKGGDGNGEVTGAEAQRWSEDLRKARKDRLARGGGNVMTASVMDYDGDLSGFAGIGRYDAAAVMFSYFNKVEAYEAADPTVDPQAQAGAETPTSLEGLKWSDQYRRELFSYYRGGETCVTHEDCPNSAGKASTTYQPIKQTCTNNPRTPNRTGNCGDGNCICSNYFDDFAAYSRGGGTYSPVDYLYCHDNREEDLSWCTTFDAGESFQETVEHYRQSWLERYPQVYFRNFKRNGPSRGYSTASIISAVKIYQHFFFRYFYDADFRNNSGPLGILDQMVASADVLNWLAEIIATPDVGNYSLDPADGSYRPAASTTPSPSAFTLQPGQGFYLWSAYQDGHNGFFRLERAGTFLDKLAAIEAVARREWYLSYTIDERYFINFYDMFAPEVIDLFGGLILRNPKAYAPRVSLDAAGQPTLSYLNLYRGLNDRTRANNESTYPGTPVDGSDSDVLRDAAAIYALSEFPVFYDTSFEQRLLVFRTGSGDGYEIPATREDGTPTCAEGAPGCTEPDYIVYDSDRLHTSFVAVVIQPRGDEPGTDEQQLGYHLLARLKQQQARARELAARDDLNATETGELSSLRASIERDETFVDYVIELSKMFGISSSL